MTGTAWQPKLIFHDQFVYGSSDVSREGFVALASWSPTLVDRPRFIIYFLDTNTRKIYESPIIDDSLTGLKILGPQKVLVELYRSIVPPQSLLIETFTQVLDDRVRDYSREQFENEDPATQYFKKLAIEQKLAKSFKSRITRFIRYLLSGRR